MGQLCVFMLYLWHFSSLWRLHMQHLYFGLTTLPARCAIAVPVATAVLMSLEGRSKINSHDRN